MDLVILVPSILSILACLFVILSFFIFVRLRTPAGVFAVWFSLAGLGNAAYPFFGDQNDDSAVCLLQAVVGTYFVLVAMFASTILATFLYGIFFKSEKYSKSSTVKIQWYHYLYAWLCPGVFALIPLIFQAYGKDDGDR
jgi:hypothetical protein